MKNLNVLFVVILYSVSAFGQVPNGGLENWTGNNPDDWLTSNVSPLALFPITQSTDSHGGSFAVRGEVIAEPDNNDPFPPVLTSLVPFPVIQDPTSFTCWYKFNPDQASTNMGFAIAVYDADDMLKGISTTLIYNETTNFTLLDLPIEYNLGNPNPAAKVSITVSVNDLLGDAPIGTFFILDDFDLGYAVGIEQVDDEFSSVAYPSPFNESCIVTTSANLMQEVQVEIYNQMGQKLSISETGNVLIETDQFTWIPGPKLTSGIYFVNVSSQTKNETFRVVYER